MVEYVEASRAAEDEEGVVTLQALEEAFDHAVSFENFDIMAFLSQFINQPNLSNFDRANGV